MQLQNNRYFFSVSSEGLLQEFAFDPFLFLQPTHLQTQSEDALLLFQLLDRKTDKIVAHLPVFLDENGKAYSPGKAPFGSVQLTVQLPETILADFLMLVKRYLLEVKNCRIMQIKSYPFAYAPASSAKLTDLLLKQNFSVTHSEINHHITVEDNSLEVKLHPSARRRLQKCRKNGFVFQEENAKALPEIWSFINACRLERHHEPPLAFEKLMDLFQKFPQHFRIFSVREQNKLAAATIAVRINNQILYNFYPASPILYNTFSPVILLNEGLYEICKQEGIEILDLGTSNLPSGPNFPLITFKKHLGGEPTLKLIFEFKTKQYNGE